MMAAGVTVAVGSGGGALVGTGGMVGGGGGVAGSVVGTGDGLVTAVVGDATATIEVGGGGTGVGVASLPQAAKTSMVNITIKSFQFFIVTSRKQLSYSCHPHPLCQMHRSLLRPHSPSPPVQSFYGVTYPVTLTMRPPKNSQYTIQPEEIRLESGSAGQFLFIPTVANDAPQPEADVTVTIGEVVGAIRPFLGRLQPGFF